MIHGVVGRARDGALERRQGVAGQPFEVVDPAEGVEVVLVLGFGGDGAAGEDLGPLELNILEGQLVGDVVLGGDVLGVALEGGSEEDDRGGGISVLESA